MTISDAQFAAWLANDKNTRVILVEATYHNGVTTAVLYTSNIAYTSEPTDTPANQYYDDRIKAIPQFTRRLSEQLSGRTTGGYGDIELDNIDGALDGYLDYGFDGRSLVIYMGDPSWAKADFRVILNGISADITARDQTTIALQARDKQYILNNPIQTTRFTTGNNIDKLMPICYGQCRNVPAVLEDSTTHKYRVHDGRVQAISTVYEDGISVAFTASVATGTFTLNAGSAAGRITADVQGAVSLGSPSTYLTKVGQIIQELLIYRLGVTISEIDTAVFSALDTLCPQTVGIYRTDGDQASNVLDELILSIGGWYGQSRAGKWQVGRFDAPTSSPVLTLTTDEIDFHGLSIKSRELPAAEISLGYKRIWAVQTDGLAGAVTETVRNELSKQYTEVKASNIAGSPLSIGSKHLLATKDAMVGTLLYNQADAENEASRRAVLKSVVRKVFAIRAAATPYTIDLGSTIKVTHPRFGLSAGVNMVVVGFEEQPTKNSMTIELWV